MPIEIKELHIRLTVNAPEGGSPSPGPNASSSQGNNNTGDKETIVAECIEQVLKILQDKRER
ncbi:MAG TPA: DUF5908 family protein [Saprospiraceae bacterium]|nr:DUF5908 family protein [Saprospiraceae bacterium]